MFRFVDLTALCYSAEFLLEQLNEAWVPACVDFLASKDIDFTPTALSLDPLLLEEFLFLFCFFGFSSTGGFLIGQYMCFFGLFCDGFLVLCFWLEGLWIGNLGMLLSSVCWT